MYNRPTGPRSIGEILDDAIRLYRESFRTVLPIQAVLSVFAIIPSLILTPSGGYSTVPAEQVRAMVTTMTSPGYIITSIVLLLVDLALYAALFTSMDAVAKGSPLPLGAVLRVGMTRLPKMFGASILMLIALLIGFLLLIIPGVYLSVSFQLVLVALVLEDAGIFSSFRIAQNLINGYWWRSLVILSMAFIIMIVLSLLPGLLVGALAAVRPTARTVLAVNQIVTVIVNLFVLGWIPSVLLAMYYDLKLRHEGGDLAARVDALAVS